MLKLSERLKMLRAFVACGCGIALLCGDSHAHPHLMGISALGLAGLLFWMQEDQ